MDQMRLLLALVLSFLVFMLWNVFFGHEAQQKPAPQLRQEAQKEKDLSQSGPLMLVPVKGVEPSTFALRMRCSTN